MRLSHITLNFGEGSDDLEITITRQEAYLQPYGASPAGMISTRMFDITRMVATAVGWSPFFVGLDEEEEY